MANRERSIPTKHSNSIPVSVSSPSFGVSHKSVGLCQKFSSTDGLSEGRNDFKPLIPNIKEQILLSCPHTFLIKVLGRSY